MTFLLALLIFLTLDRLDRTSPGFCNHRSVEALVFLVLVVALIADGAAWWRAWL